MAKADKIKGAPPVISNRKAYHDYTVLEELEAGIVLAGCEVKMIRRGNLQLGDAYAEFLPGSGPRAFELWLVGSQIPPYPQASTHAQPYEPRRKRKLLLRRDELTRLRRKVVEKGVTIVPLKAYFSGGKVKIQLGLVQGKKLYDKRETIKKRDIERTELRSNRRG